MPRIQYKTFKFTQATMDTIAKADEICRTYAAQGYTLTLRQLYYQFVARDLIPNKQTEYKRLGSILNDARLAGLLDWSHMEDRTRNLRSVGHWEDPANIIEASAHSFRLDKWEDQPYYVEVWVEKDALVGVLDRVCTEMDIPYFSCRGYTSQSELWSAGQRLASKMQDGKQVKVIHLGDHDPSGMDMSRDITDRLQLFTARHIAPSKWDALQVDRIALNMSQIEQYDPPPNPAKLTDSRADGYIRDYGYDSWELDALEPTVIDGLIRDSVIAVRDDDLYLAACAQEDDYQTLLYKASDNWEAVADFLQTLEK